MHLKNFGNNSFHTKTLKTNAFSPFPLGSPGKESACNAGDLGSVPALGRSPGKGKSYPL